MYETKKFRGTTQIAVYRQPLKILNGNYSFSLNGISTLGETTRKLHIDLRVVLSCTKRQLSKSERNKSYSLS